MQPFVVVTTPSCSRCKVIKNITADLGLQDKINFVGHNSDLGAALLEKYPGLGAGVIINPDTGVELEVANFIKLADK